MPEPIYHSLKDIHKHVSEGCKSHHKKIKSEWGYPRFISATTAELLLIFVYYRASLFLIPLKDRIYASLFALAVVAVIKIIWGLIKDKLPPEIDELMRGKYFWGCDTHLLHGIIIFFILIHTALLWLPLNILLRIYNKFKSFSYARQ